MKKIVSFMRGANGVEVVVSEDGRLKQFSFLKSRSDADIFAEVMEAAVKIAPTPPVEPPVEPPVAPTPPVEPPVDDSKQKITRDQMIAALDTAGVTDFDPSKFRSVQGAYNKLSKPDKVK